MSFWENLSRPFFVMAPLADVTDVAFRALVAKRGKPDVFWTEFVSADGLYYTRELKKIPDAENPLMRDLLIGEGQRPIVAQIFSAKPEMIAYAARLVEELGFDGVDINMGCPDSSVEKQGAGAGLIKTPELAVEIVKAAQGATALPVSVKTRVGYNTEILDEWLPKLLSAEPAAITLHLRTRKEMSLVPARWELMKRAVELRNRINPCIPLIGNGDVLDLDDAKARVADTGCDGAMIGRGMFGNPWVFAGRKTGDTSLTEKLAALLELAQGFEKLVPAKNFSILKKHVKAFVTGFDGAAELRARLMEANSAAELQSALKSAGY
ncbi:MAG: tRNA-dihydrouridine synthase [Candidatus Paceibacterota bacterium]